MNKAELIDVLTKKLDTDRRTATDAVENVVDTSCVRCIRVTASPLPVSAYSNSAVVQPGSRVIRAPARQ